MFTDTPMELALPVMGRLKRKFGGLEFGRGDNIFFITFSVGAAEYPVNGQNEEELMAWADRDMYRNKKMFKAEAPGD